MNESQKREARISTDPKLLDNLAKEYGRGVQTEVARNLSTSRETLDWMAKNVNWWEVIEPLIDHKNTTVEMIEWIINNKAKPPSAFGQLFGTPYMISAQQASATRTLAKCTIALNRLIKNPIAKKEEESYFTEEDKDIKMQEAEFTEDEKKILKEKDDAIKRQDTICFLVIVMIVLIVVFIAILSCPPGRPRPLGRG
jgi:hypothetical protein